jgi:hypothetical protein
MRARIAALLGALALAACSTLPKLDAASDIHTFLVAIRDGDRATFDAHVDREALKAQLRARAVSETSRATARPEALGLAFLAGPLVDVAVDALLRPEVFRAVAEMRGYSASRPIPGSFAIAQLVRPIGGDAVCVTNDKGGPCILVFKNEGGTYRLTGFEGDLSLLRPGR